MWYRRTIPLVLVFVVGVLGFVHDFIPHPVSGDFRETVTTWFRIIGAFAVFIGFYSLMRMHYTRIRRRQAGWAYSGFVFLGALAMIAVGFYNQGKGPLAPVPGEGTWFQWGYDYIQVPCGATIFSILAFFMASAAFRTFRARNAEAGLLLAAAIIVMVGRVPVGALISDWLPLVSDWIMEHPNLAAKRGILLGISLGIISQSLRILFGIERSYLGGSE
ncbi:MAG: hypothetical protein ACLF0G_13910 [Candidatus Brocadiia bacterium]